MIRVLSYRTPEEARRRLDFLGVPEGERSGLLAQLRPYLLFVPGDPETLLKLSRLLAVCAIPAAAAGRGMVFSVSGEEGLPGESKEAGNAGAGALLRGVREALLRCKQSRFSVPCRDRVLELGDRPRIMGILNVTPDSFSDGGRFLNREAAVRHGLAMAAEGADLLDVGGESTRPGSEGVTPEVERERVVPVIRELSRQTDLPISVDTTKASVAREAVAAGARIVNDTSALGDDPEMAAAVAESGCAVVLMHRRGIPRTMQDAPRYESLFGELLSELSERVEAAVAAGIPRERILVDPGIGFGKRPSDNLALHRHLADLKVLGRPLVVGPSRKSFLGRITGRPETERGYATAAAVAIAAWQGAHVLRVHDVREMADAVRVAHGILAGEEC